MTDEVYVTLAHDGCASFVEKKSEFIGYARPCKTEEEALAFIAEIRHKHGDAKHNVYAYSLKENNCMRFSDAGEPQGTAGMPVLEVIRKSGFTDACIVVTRYFGGILLGTGGLVRAYSHAAKIAVDDAQIITYERFLTVELILDYSDYNTVLQVMKNYGILTDKTDFTQDVTVSLAIRRAECDSFLADVTEITNGAVLYTVTGERYDHL